MVRQIVRLEELVVFLASLAALVIVYGLITDNTLPTGLGLILTAHIGMDRFLGFGLKYPSGFKDTHRQRL